MRVECEAWALNAVQEEATARTDTTWLDFNHNILQAFGSLLAHIQHIFGSYWALIRTVQKLELTLI